jgi:hypothetical protein
VAACLVGVACAHDASSATASHYQACRPDGPRFTRYFVGQSFDGLPLTDNSYECRPPTPQPITREDFVSFVYGDCTQGPGDEGGCAPPLEIQTWPACDTWYSQYRFGNPGDPTGGPALVRRRGVPASFIDKLPGEIQLEVYTGDVGVRIFSDTRDRAERVVRALRSVSGSPDQVDAEVPMPPPVHGALSGRLDCGFRFQRLGVRPLKCHGHSCRAELQLKLGRRSYVDAELERCVPSHQKPHHCRFSSEDQELFTARAGTTRRRVHLPPGRYRVSVTAWDLAGRRTPTGKLNFRLPGR